VSEFPQAPELFPGSPDAVLPASPRRRWWPWVVGAVVLALTAVSLTVIVPLVRKGIHEVQASQRTMRAYLTAVQSGDVTAAEALLCDEAKKELTTEELTQELVAGKQELGAITSFKITNTMVNKDFTDGSRSTTAEVEYTVHYDKSSAQHREGLLVKEHGAWKVCGFR
jgi:hypothetical protein